MQGSNEPESSIKFQRPNSHPTATSATTTPNWSIDLRQKETKARLILRQPQAVSFQVSQLEPVAHKPTKESFSQGAQDAPHFDVLLSAQGEGTAGTQDRPVYLQETLQKTLQIHDNSQRPQLFESLASESSEETVPQSISRINSDSVERPLSGAGGIIRKREIDLDYGLDQLAGMRFEQLHDEAFHANPDGREFAFPPSLIDSTLMDKLVYLVGRDDVKNKISEQKTFLNSLPIEDYEECGDLIIERFDGIVRKFKAARRERRRVAREFELEVSRREECVREKIKAYGDDLDRLKRSGNDVVRKRLAV